MRERKKKLNVMVRIQVIRVYDVLIRKVDTVEDALEKALAMQSTELTRRGKLVDVMTDHAEALYNEDAE